MKSKSNGCKVHKICTFVKNHSYHIDLKVLVGYEVNMVHASIMALEQRQERNWSYCTTPDLTTSGVYYFVFPPGMC